MKILNIGWGGIHMTAEPGLEEITVDFVEPADIVCDAKKLTIEDEFADGIYASHILEHFYSHEVVPTLKEWLRVMKPGGKAIILTPDLIDNMKMALTFGLECKSIPTAGVGNITPLDVIYGFGKEIETGKEGMAHKTGFDVARLQRVMEEAGFREVTVLKTEGANAALAGIGFK